MEFLVPILFYLGYSIIASIIKKLKNEYQEPDLAPYAPKEGSDQEGTSKSDKQLLNDDPDSEKPPFENNKSKKEEAEDSAREINKKGTAELEIEEERRKLRARQAEAEKKQQEVRKKLKEKQEKNASVAKKNNTRLDIKNLDRDKLQQGVILAEILKPPRAKRPYRSKNS
ncbi:hypothetical protein [Sporohalobacter salinus]|uniref:hypothetical protein n=1 Tax=Sporohalobacter salinus TaxID=1494606 RepID=UPI001960581C|nr:hypothetical protein [Sporohalobacter salinus]MBM7623152.1 type IV secretory pathway VirB10-like protein [Sporohalobacter salinus]